MTAIQTRFIGPTNLHGSRVKARALGTGHTATIEWDDAKNPRENHIDAAMYLANSHGWMEYGRWHMGDAGQGGYVFVCAVTHGGDGFGGAEKGEQS
jgi:hypothetical protein